MLQKRSIKADLKCITSQWWTLLLGETPKLCRLNRRENASHFGRWTKPAERMNWPNFFSRLFIELRTITSLPNGRVRKLHIDSCTALNSIPVLDNALEAVNTTVTRLPPNCTHLVQPLDQLVLREFKALFRKSGMCVVHKWLWITSIRMRAGSQIPVNTLIWSW